MVESDEYSGETQMKTYCVGQLSVLNTVSAKFSVLKNEGRTQLENDRIAC